MQASVDIEALSQEIYNESAFVDKVMEASGRVIVGQNYMINRLLLGLLAAGHVLLEGLPGLAKTLAIKTLASTVDASFSRIQFTPDLLPADIIGTMIYNPSTSQFSVRQGPIFAQFILAD
ncbi:MAG: AAA family ATPase, partial [Saprospiraceae bacterium]